MIDESVEKYNKIENSDITTTIVMNIYNYVESQKAQSSPQGNELDQNQQSVSQEDSIQSDNTSIYIDDVSQTGCCGLFCKYFTS